MAPTQAQVEDQTCKIIDCLFADKDYTVFRQLTCDLETDGPEDAFDASAIAAKLRSVADTLDADTQFKAAVDQMKIAVVQEAVDAAFTQGVESLFQSPASQPAEVTPEMQLIQASVALGLYIKKSCPELKIKVQNAMAAFLNRRVGTWVVQQGGWDKVAENSSAATRKRT